MSLLARRGLPLLALLLVGITAFSIVYAIRANGRVRQLSATRDELQAAAAQTRAQVAELSAKVAALAAAPKPDPAVRPDLAPVNSATDAPARRSRPRAAVRLGSRRAAAPDPRWKKLQSQLDEQQKQLASTQDDVKKTREELQGRLDSTRDELNGSIARNHDELVELRKRGERNYYEFTAVKSKQFQRTGPVSLSLSKADTKHKRFNLALLVDDVKLEKKNVNLYEPVLIYLPDRPQPLELVANEITKNQIKGYLSEPKYKKSELSATATAAKPEPPSLKER